MARAAADGAGDRGRLMRAGDVQPEDFLAAQGYLFACPENLAAMSGEFKEMFDRCYYPLLDRVQARPYAALIAGGSDGSNALRQLERIVTGWRLKAVVDPLIYLTGAQEPEEILAEKHVDPAILRKCHDIGAALAEGVDLGIF